MTKKNSISQLTPGDIVTIGFPSDVNSSFLRGSAEAPPLIRQALYSGSSNTCAENGIDILEDDHYHDFGDLKLAPDPHCFKPLEQAISGILNKGARSITLGGDHAITYPIIRSYAQEYPNLHLIHFDAHPDLYHDFEGNPHSHASPFARIMENQLVDRLTQIGIRTLNNHQREQVERFGIAIIEAREFKKDLQLTIEQPVYISLDLDVLDPAFAPGISHHEPGGLSVRDVISVIQNIKAPIVGADIVEYNPSRDFGNMTAMVGAKFLKEIAGHMLS